MHKCMQCSEGGRRPGARLTAAPGQGCMEASAGGWQRHEHKPLEAKSGCGGWPAAGQAGRAAHSYKGWCCCRITVAAAATPWPVIAPLLACKLLPAAANRWLLLQAVGCCCVYTRDSSSVLVRLPLRRLL